MKPATAATIGTVSSPVDAVTAPADPAGEPVAPATAGRAIAPPTIDEVRTALATVVDPELGADIVTLGMVGPITIGDDGAIDVTVKLTISGCPMRAQIQRDVRERVHVHPGVSAVSITWGEMTQDERSDTMLRARWHAREQAAPTRVPARTRVLAIASGKGGVGKSSVTVNLAVALARRGRRVGVLDADIWGFSVPRLLGMTARLDARQADDGRALIQPNVLAVGEGSLHVVSTGFLVAEDTALMWRGLMLTKAVEQFLRDVEWGDLDDLLIDMPPGTGDVQMGLARLLPRAQMIVVTTPARAAQKVAQRAADMARRSFVDVVGVIENMSAFTCAHGERHALFGAGGGAELATDLGVPLLGEVPLEPAVAEGGDNGVPVALAGQSAAAEAFRSIAAALDAAAPPPADDDDVDMSACSNRLFDVATTSGEPVPVAVSGRRG